MRLPAFAAVALLAGCLGVSPDMTPHDVCGNVLGPDDEPVAGAEVLANRRSKGFGTSTDLAGHFCIGRLTEGSYRLTVGKAGFAPHESTLKVPHPADLTVRLGPA